MLKVGIVGLPNVGKSTLFNALTAVGAPAENYPFTTVEPNVGTVEVPDPRLDHLFERSGSAVRVPAYLHVVDIAGLVEGASQGAGLGNRFLAQIREVDAIAQVVRCFEDPDVIHVLGGVDPVRDREIVEAELALADLETVERRLERVAKKARSGDRTATSEEAILWRLRDTLGRGKAVRSLPLSEPERVLVRELHLLTAKPMLYVANIEETALPGGRNAHAERLGEALAAEGDAARMLPISTRIEAELVELEPGERREFFRGLGLEESGLERFAHAAYELLGLITFFTINEKETRAWTVLRGTLAPAAAGIIHSDFERGFIRADTISFDDLRAAGTMRAARDHGLVRSEGKDYLVRDGDIILFRFHV
ncbi:MAG: redox-regulated ATPase YchF [Gemmatimonadetes bacterium]|nr:redox-regulated ATPase YchF [Gemmatimonadota bacterium]